MGYTASKLIAIAEADVGYLEKKSNQLANKCRNRKQENSADEFFSAVIRLIFVSAVIDKQHDPP